MILWKLIVGILLIIASIAMPISSVLRTPENLRGFYGSMFWTISLVGLVGGITLTITAFV